MEQLTDSIIAHFGSIEDPRVDNKVLSKLAP